MPKEGESKGGGGVSSLHPGLLASLPASRLSASGESTREGLYVPSLSFQDEGLGRFLVSCLGYLEVSFGAYERFGVLFVSSDVTVDFDR